MTLCNHWCFPGDGDLEVLIEVECGDREISVAFGDVEILEEDVVDVGVGVDGALRRGRRFHRPVAVTLKAAGPFGGFPSEIVDDGRGVGNVV